MESIDPRVTAALAAHKVCIAAAMAEAMRQRPDFMATLAGIAEQVMRAGEATFTNTAQLNAYKTEASDLLSKVDAVLTTIHRQSGISAPPAG